MNSFFYYLCPPPNDRFRDVAQPGSALAWGARGRKFESCRPDQLTAQIRLKPVSIQYLQAFFISSLSKNIKEKQTSSEQTGEQI